MADTLKVKRGQIKAKLTRFQTYFKAIDLDNIQSNNIIELNLRLNRFEGCFDEFNEIQSELEITAPSDSDAIEREQFENLYFDIYAKAKSIVEQNCHADNNKQDSDHCSNISNVSSKNNFVKLPTIKLPTFDGQYYNWLEFKDIFSAIVNNNDDLSQIQKFYYLRSSLGKEPAHVIKSIEVTAANYEIAWEMLIDRYENKNLMIHNHIRAIFEHPNINKESHIELRNMFDSVTKHLRSLNTLGENTNSWDRLIIFILVNKFDNITRRDWEAYKHEKDLPSMSDMNKFLKERCEMLEKLEINKYERNKSQFSSRKINISSSLVSNVNSGLRCHFCKEGHAIYNCDSLLNLPVEKRIPEIKNRKLCVNCLKPSHNAWQCKSRKCIKCNRAHNSLLHINLPVQNKENRSNPAENNENQTDSNLCSSVQPSIVGDSVNCTYSNARSTAPTEVLLSTALVKIKVNNSMVIARALLDSGSQSNFVTEKLCDKLNIKGSPINHIVKGVGQTMTSINRQTNINIISNNQDFSMNINCLVIPKITDKLPKVSFDKSVLTLPKHCMLADPSFNNSADIDILLGSHAFWSIMCPETKILGENCPILQKTQLGWVIAGNVCLHSSCSLTHFNTNVSEGIDERIAKFWTLEECSNKLNNLSESEKYCEQCFENTTKRDTSGKFIVNIPFNASVKNLGKSYEIALNRFYALERRLANNRDLRTDYINFMKEYEVMNHMTECKNTLDQQRGCYLPHHAVVKQSSITTKCRVVFDASSKTDSGLSLNEAQHTGPALQNDIFDILLRFRKYNYVIMADISKMYRQILINDDQRCYQKILWRSSPDEKLKCFQLNTVTYGTASAPYLAVKCLKQIAEETKAKSPISSKIIADDFYVDDLLTGSDSAQEVIEIQQSVSKILANYGFELRKWLCNDKNVLNEFLLHENLEANIINIGDHESNKTLGIYWNASADIIQYSICNFKNNFLFNKRKILSTICQIYDPLGLLGPVITFAKLIIQELWRMKLSWDEEVPEKVKNLWLRFQTELNFINTLNIPRHCTISEYIMIELHGFADASEKAYGACLYIRSFNNSRGYCSNLLCAKTRIAPLKKVSLPRLELCGALLLANLFKKTIDAIDISFDSKYLWTDSTITLAWIKAEPGRWKTFVANRVSEIQSLSNINEWYHVKSEENPADMLSRGINPKSINESELWWQGPYWLSCDKEQWNISDVSVDTDIPEQRSTSSVLSSIDHIDIMSELIKRISSFNRLLRISAYMLRFVNNIRRKPCERIYSVLTPLELENSLLVLVKTVQLDCFAKEYNCLLNKKELSNKSTILTLNPFIHNGIMRVGGRIQNSKLPFDSKHQIILPKGHVFTDLILRHEHERLMHCGVQSLIYAVREKFWPLSVRNSSKKIVRTCIKCFRVKPKESNYLMGNLPDFRVNDYLPFVNVGVDYGGPFLMKDRNTRRANITKAYICLFVCMCSKAIHLELVTELTTTAFLAALKRFISRRGKPSNIYSDNGLNFVGANNELRKIYEFLEAEANNISNKLSAQRITWHFIPARSPNFGGLWEAGIRSAKFHIKRVVSNSTLTYEEFYTILTQIESILNSRPLSAISNDPNDLAALTPSHFLIGRSLTALPELNVMSIPENRLSKFQRLQAMAQHFWKRWSKEYLAELQTRTKWKKNSQLLVHVGSLVIVKNENYPPQNWQLGRIIKVYPGIDNIVRVVDIQLARGVVKRAVNKICVLPIN